MDPLADLLNNINKNPAAYNNNQSLNSVTEVEQCNGQISKKFPQLETETIEQCTKKTGSSHKEGTDVSRGDVPTIQEHRSNKN